MVTSSNSAPTPTAHPAITPQVLGVPGVMGASMTRSGEGVGVGPQMAEVWGREEVHRGNGQGDWVAEPQGSWRGARTEMGWGGEGGKGLWGGGLASGLTFPQGS